MEPSNTQKDIISRLDLSQEYKVSSTYENQSV